MGAIDIARALRAELEARGYVVGGDTVGLRGELYVRGEHDRAKALFEFKPTVREALDTMYQGSWLPDMPPRFAVLPDSQEDDPELDLLRQAGLSVLLYQKRGTDVVFDDLDVALEKIGSG